MTETLIEQWDCLEGYLKLNSFWGGKDNRRCVQLTSPSGTGYVQMTYDDARLFFKLAIEEIDKVEARYNENAPWWETINNSSETTKINKEKTQ